MAYNQFKINKGTGLFESVLSDGGVRDRQISQVDAAKNNDLEGMEASRSDNGGGQKYSKLRDDGEFNQNPYQ